MDEVLPCSYFVFEIKKEHYNPLQQIFFANVGQCFVHVLLLILGNIQEKLI